MHNCTVPRKRNIILCLCLIHTARFPVTTEDVYDCTVKSSVTIKKHYSTITYVSTTAKMTTHYYNYNQPEYTKTETDDY